MVTRPTAPVAPTTPMRGSLGKTEGLVQRADGSVDVAARHVARDLDRRGRDDRRGDPRRLERLERLGGDSRVALHARANERDLAEVVARVPRGAELVERPVGV